MITFQAAEHIPGNYYGNEALARGATKGMQGGGKGPEVWPGRDGRRDHERQQGQAIAGQARMGQQDGGGWANRPSQGGAGMTGMPVMAWGKGPGAAGAAQAGVQGWAGGGRGFDALGGAGWQALEEEEE